MQVFGHRGSPGLPRFGESTRTSFRKALNAGAAGFELDVRRCADGTLIVLHDATIDRTTTGSGLAASLTYPELSRFDAGYGDSIPRLIDVLNEFAGLCTINVELKEAGLSKDVASIAQRNVVVSAFEEYWSDLEDMASKIPVALLISSRELQRIGHQPFVDAARRLGARAIHPPQDVVTRDLVDIAHKADLSVRTWTVNDPQEAVRFCDLGVEAIFSDVPELCLKALRQ